MSTSCIRRLVPLAAIVGLALLQGRATAQYVWISAASGNWSTVANWTGGVPVSSATTTLTFGAGTYTATDDLAASPFLLTGLTFGSSGTATLSDSGQGLSFGGATPTITMGSGNAVINPPITLPPATTPGSAGPPIVPATLSAVTISGGATPGTLTFNGAISDGSAATAIGGASSLVNKSTGTVNITGGGNITQLLLEAGTTNIPSGTLAITYFDNGQRPAGIGLGEASGQTAVLNIKSGATVNVTSNVFIGDVPGSTGTVNVDGAGTSLTLNFGLAASNGLGRLAVGQDGTGTLNITNGGVVSTNFLFTPRNGLITGPPTGTPTNSGTINVSGPGSTLNVATEASFASNGFGTATFSNGAQFNGSGASFILGVNPLGNGSVTFTGSGTTATVGQAIIGYAKTIAATQTSTLNITNGATFTAVNSVFIGLGYAGNPEAGTNPAVGIVNVSGPGSTLNVPDPNNNTTSEAYVNAATGLIVGGGSGPGVGTLNITAGGTVVTSYLTIGNNPGATGTINLSGAGSRLTSAGEADISPGTSGGVINAGVGTIVSLGPTYVWTGGVLNVNTGTLGSFTVNGLSGGYANASAGLTASNGTVAVGAGSTLVIAPDGNNGGQTTPSFAGIISGAGGVTMAGPGTQIFTGGVNTFTGPLGLNGGVLNFGVIGDLGLGTAINFGGGTLQYATGNTADISARTVTFNFGGATIDTGANNVTFLNGIGNNGNGGLTKVGIGTLTLTPAPPAGGTVGYNSYLGATNILNGTLSVASDVALGVINTGTAAAPVFVEGGNVTGAAAGTLSFTGTTSTPRSYTMNGGTITVASGQTVTFVGGVVSGATLNGSGTFATDPTAGAHFVGVTSTPSVTITSNSALDQFVNYSNSSPLSIAAGVGAAGVGGGLPTGVSFSGFTNQGAGSVTVGAVSFVNVSNFQSYGVLTLNPAVPGSGKFTEMVNVGTSPLFFNGGSRTFLGTPATANFMGSPAFVAGINLNGQNLDIAGGLFVNNGFVVDTSSGTQGKVIVDYGALYKGAGYTGVVVVTQNGGKVQAGNSPGMASFGQFVFGPGGVSNYVFAIDNATGAAGPSPNASGQVSGWGLLKAIQHSTGASVSSGNFTWTADSSNKLNVAVDTLVNPTTVGSDVAGAMANFNPNAAFSWPAAEWAGTYSGPTNAAALNAATSFDTSGFLNPISGTFGWNLDAEDHMLSLVYTPSAVPEPGTLALTALAGLGLARSIRRRYLGGKIRGS